MLSRASVPICWVVAAMLLRATGPSMNELTRLDGLSDRLLVTPESVLAQLAAALAWVLLLWLAVGWLALWGAHARGRAGRLCQGIAAAVVPRVLRGVLEGGIGLSVVLSSTPALAASMPAASTPVASVAATPAVSQPALLPSLDRRPATDLQLAPLPAVPAPVLAPASAPGADPVIHGQHPDEPAEIVVRRGDCLWSVVARALGPDAEDAAVARALPHWYAANRAAIGPDPDLLLPGQRLIVPDRTP